MQKNSNSTPIIFLVNNHTHEAHEYKGFKYSKVDGVYGYLGIDLNEVIFFYESDGEIRKDVLTNWSIRDFAPKMPKEVYIPEAGDLFYWLPDELNEVGVDGFSVTVFYCKSKNNSLCEIAVIGYQFPTIWDFDKLAGNGMHARFIRKATESDLKDLFDGNDIKI